MTTKANVFLQTGAMALVSLGVTTIGTNLIAGVVELILGFAAIVIYEMTP